MYELPLSDIDAHVRERLALCVIKNQIPCVQFTLIQRHTDTADFFASARQRQIEFVSIDMANESAAIETAVRVVSPVVVGRIGQTHSVYDEVVHLGVSRYRSASWRGAASDEQDEYQQERDVFHAPNLRCVSVVCKVMPNETGSNQLISSKIRPRLSF